MAALPDRGGLLAPIPEAGLHHRFAVAPIRAPRGRWGTLAIIEHGSRLGALLTQHSAGNDNWS